MLKILDKLRLFLLGYRYKGIPIKYQKNDKLSVVYALNDSLPEVSNGYTVRSHHIITSLQRENIPVAPVTRLNFTSDSLSSTVDTIEYSRLYEKGYTQKTTLTTEYIQQYVRKLAVFAQEEQATLIHAASNYVNGLAAINAAKILDIPSIYEVRGFWELTEASRDPQFKDSISFRIQKKLETQACHDATAVIALSEIVKEELLRRGVKEEKVYIVPNDVDTKKLNPLKKNEALLTKLNWHNKFVVGFIGSVVDYEGLILLVHAAEKLHQLGNNSIRYLIVGDGNALENLKEEIDKKALTDLFVFTGRVPYEAVEQYYSIMDVACYPRLNWEVCKIVSPKKPFEAMAYGIPVISSSVHANSYFIKDGITGLIHQHENVNDLAEKILLLSKNKPLRDKISTNARAWVIEHRDSSATGTMMKNIYLKIIENYNSSNQL